MRLVLTGVGPCLSALVALTGCFAEINAAYVPGMTMERTSSSSGTSLEHDDAALVFGINAGVYLDLYGVGVSYGFIGEDTVRNASGVPDHLGGTGTWLRGDLDLPVRFAAGLLGLRATYVYASYDRVKAGPNVDGENQSLDGGGHSHFGGLSVAVPGNDLSLALGVKTFALESQPQLGWPGLRTSGTGPAARLMIRWIPTGAMWARYRPPTIATGSTSSGNACPSPRTTRTCTYHQSGYRCYETTSCH